MVALQILVLPVHVRPMVPQQSSLKVSKNRLLLGKGKSKKDSRQSLDDATMLEDQGCFTERIGFEVKSGQFREEPYESLQPQVKKRASA